MTTNQSNITPSGHLLQSTSSLFKLLFQLPLLLPLTTVTGFLYFLANDICFSCLLHLPPDPVSGWLPLLTLWIALIIFPLLACGAIVIDICNQDKLKNLKSSRIILMGIWLLLIVVSIPTLSIVHWLSNLI